MPYNTTTLERDLALALGIPMYGADPRLFDLGTKTGCRRLFAEEGVRHPIGFEDLHTMDDLLDATLRLRRERPSIQSVIVKLNEGVSGEGNAMVDLRGLPPPGSAEERAAIAERLRPMEFERPDTPFDAYVAKLGQRAASSRNASPAPSCAARACSCGSLPGGQVELLSTHDQLLGGPSGRATSAAASRRTSPTRRRSAARR